MWPNVNSDGRSTPTPPAAAGGTASPNSTAVSLRLLLNPIAAFLAVLLPEEDVEAVAEVPEWVSEPPINPSRLSPPTGAAATDLPPVRFAGDSL